MDPSAPIDPDAAEDSDADFAIDPALAAQMGFSAFGGLDKDARAAKRQKQSHPQSHPQPQPQSHPQPQPPPHRPTGANNVPVGGPRPPRAPQTQGSRPANGFGDDRRSGARTRPSGGRGPDTVQGEPGVRPGQEGRGSGAGGEAEGWGRGFQRTNAAGDAVYYDPSSVEDPWAGLVAKRWGQR